MGSQAQPDTTAVTDPFSLQGKRILITGGTRGIGRAISMRFARAGASVLANYVRDAAAAESLAMEAEGEELTVQSIRADLTSPKGIDELLSAVQTSFGTLSCLIHCAATGIHKPFEELTLRHMDWTFNLNVRAFFDLSRRLLPMFGAGSTIVGISSEGALRAVPQYALVGSTKGALEALLRHMAVELLRGEFGSMPSCLASCRRTYGTCCLTASVGSPKRRGGRRSAG